MKTAYCGHPSYHDTPNCTDIKCGNHHCELDIERWQEDRAELARLRAELSAARAVIDEIGDELYGKGLQVLGWHLNGDTEPLDSWFEQNKWLSYATPKAAEAGRQGEGE